MGETAEALDRLDRDWSPFSDAIHRLGPDGLGQATDAGWTAREMLAHVAFWDEAAVPVLTYMLRGLEIPSEPWFESGYKPGDEWPPEGVHNAREAAWGRDRTGTEVMARAERAHVKLIATVTSLADDEAAQRADYLRDQAAHYAKHLAEIRALLP